MNLRKIISVFLVLMMVIPATIGVNAEEQERQITVFSDTFEDTKAADWTSVSGSWQAMEAMGGTLLEDNFDDGDAGDWTKNRGTWNPVLIQGNYKYSGSDPNITAMSTKGELTWTNYTIEQECTILSDITTGGPVFLFRYVDNSNYYRIHISKAYIELIRTKDGVQKWLATKKYTDLKQNIPFNVKISAVGGNIELYIDGNKMIAYNDTDAAAILAGKVGVGAYKSTCAFDNVKVMQKLPVGKWFSCSGSAGGTATAGYPEWTDYSAKATVYMTKTGAFTGLGLRYLDGDNKYSLVGDGSTIKIEKTVNGVNTILAQKALTLQAGREYSFEGKANGQNVEFLIDGTVQLTAQDNGLTAGKVALIAGNDRVSFDNVEVKRTYTPFANTVSAGSTNYYVSSSTGNDANDGLTPQTPWKTLLKVSSVTFAPGDTIHLKAGDIWDEMYDADITKPGTETYGVMLQGSGTKENPITLTRYGEGNAPLIRSAARALVYGKNVSGWVVRDMKLFITTSGFLTDWSKLGVGVNFRVESDKNPIHDIRIDNNEIYAIDYNHCSRGIVLSATCYTQSTQVQASNITISNNYIHDVGWVGISSAAWDAQKGREYFYQGLFDNVVVTMNDIYYTANSGILMSSLCNSEISRNIVDHGGQYQGNDLTWTPGGIWPLASKNVMMKFNEASFMSDSGTGWDGTGLNIDWDNTNVTMIYNYTHDNVGPGITTMSVNDCKILNNKVERNATRIDELGQIMVGDFSGRPDLMTGVKNTIVSNNTVIHNLANKPAIQYRHVTEGDAWSGNKILNNNVAMVGNAATGLTVEIRPGTVADEVNGNRYYLEPGIAFAADQYGVRYSLQNWQNTLGYDTNTVVSGFDNTKPSPITRLVALEMPDSVEVLWGQVSDTSSGVAHYNIYRGTTPDFTPAYRNMMGEATGSSFVDTETREPGITYYYKVEAEDYCGNVSDASGAGVQPLQDNTPAVTTAELSGTGANGWFNTDVTVSLSATDDLSGVEQTQYKMDNSIEWIPYSEPFTISDEGSHAIMYASIDIAGNQEEIKQELVKIDKTPPTTTSYTGDMQISSSGTYDSRVNITLSSEDGAAGSGVTGIKYSFDGEHWLDYLQPITLTEDGDYVLQYRAEDTAGNVEEVRSLSVSVDLNPDIMVSYLRDKVNAMALEEGIKNSLVSKLDSALGSLTAENKWKAAANQLNAFTNEVNAQSGKKLTAEDAQMLILEADKIIVKLTE